MKEDRAIGKGRLSSSIGGLKTVVPAPLKTVYEETLSGPIAIAVRFSPSIRLGTQWKMSVCIGRGPTNPLRLSAARFI